MSTSATRRFLRTMPCRGADVKVAPIAEEPGPVPGIARRRRTAAAPAAAAALSPLPRSKAWIRLSSTFHSASQVSSSGPNPNQLTKNSRLDERAGCRTASKLSTSNHGAPAASTSTTPPCARLRFLLGAAAMDADAAALVDRAT
eukprot:scaffold11460_cov64-Phaeocystis_antarctica.AAC.4